MRGSCDQSVLYEKILSIRRNIEQSSWKVFSFGLITCNVKTHMVLDEIFMFQPITIFCAFCI